MKYPTKLKLHYSQETILKAKSKPVTEFDDSLKEFCAAMTVILSSKGALGLSAPQVGVSMRIFVTRQKPFIWINPVIESYEGTIYKREGCLSFPGMFNRLMRHRKIKACYYDIDGKCHEKSLDAKKGMLGVVVQHELDHLDGILFTDRLKEQQDE